MRRWKVLPEEIKAEIRAARALGWSYMRIAEELDLSPSVVYRWGRVHG